jgi:hypothetical protein
MESSFSKIREVPELKFTGRKPDFDPKTDFIPTKKVAWIIANSTYKNVNINGV